MHPRAVTLAVALLVLAAGCGNDDPTPVISWDTSALTADQRAAFRAEATAWERRELRHLFLFSRPHNGVVQFRDLPFPKWARHTIEFGMHVIAYRMDFPWQLSPVCFRQVTAHELGHSIGYGHSDDTKSVMYPDIQC